MVRRLKQEYDGKVEIRMFNLDRGEGETEYAQAGGEYVPMFVLAKSDGVRTEFFYGEVPEADLRRKLDALK